MARFVPSGGLVAFIAGVGVAFLGVSPCAEAQSGIVVWGNHPAPELPGGLTYVEVAASWSGQGFYAARRSDGSIVTWGAMPAAPALPSGLTYVEVFAGSAHMLALRSDGSLIGWGWNQFGQCDPPPLPIGLTYVQAAGCWGHSLAVRSDGSVVAWGSNVYGECDVPSLPPGLTYVEVEAGGNWAGESFGFSVARRSDGSVVVWGDCAFFGQCNVPPLPTGLTFVKIAAGTEHVTALRSDGTVVAWGSNGYGECDIPTLPSGVRYTDIRAAGVHNVARRSDGGIVAWGSNFWGDRYLPSLPDGLAYVEVETYGVGRFEGCPTCELPFCIGDGSGGGAPCPCGNTGGVRRGCDNSASTGGASLTVQGSVDPDRVDLGVTGTLPSSLCLFFQGRSVLGTPAAFGDGRRCIGSALKRLGVATAVSGSAHYPGVGGPPISARSASLGDLIRPGTFRYYQTYYRDPHPAFCTPTTFNASNAVMVRW